MVTFLELLLHVMSGWIVILWDGVPIHCSRVIREFPGSEAVSRLHLGRLPAHAPELKPGEGLRAHLKGGAAPHVLLQSAVFAGRTPCGGQASAS
jgi:hypothetical protein